MNTLRAIEMIDEYLLEPNSIDGKCIEFLLYCRKMLANIEKQESKINGLIAGQETLQEYIKIIKKERNEAIERVEELESKIRIMRKNVGKADTDGFYKKFWEDTH